MRYIYFCITQSCCQSNKEDTIIKYIILRTWPQNYFTSLYEIYNIIIIITFICANVLSHISLFVYPTSTSSSMSSPSIHVLWLWWSTLRYCIVWLLFSNVRPAREVKKIIQRFYLSKYPHIYWSNIRELIWFENVM